MSEISDKEPSNCDVHLHEEIEVLKQALADKQSQLIVMETACLRESDRQVELEDSIIAWQDKYDRLYESHKRVQKVNQTLEDKLLKLVDRNSGERAQLTSDVATLSVRLAQANYNIAKLQHEIERYKTDINLAIQLLQCKPDSFVPQKVSSLPIEIQSKVSSYMRLETNSHSDSEGSTNGVGLATSGSYKVLPASDSPPPLCPFPPTAMVYSMRGLDARINSDCNNTNGDQMISPSIMAKYLEEELKASEIKHCDTCNCSTKDLTVVLADEPKSYSAGTQTLIQSESGNSLCLRCNSNLNSPSRTNSPYIMKIVKSSDSVISETKSSVSDLLDNEKLFTPAKKDDLMVNPILGHHRLCDRTAAAIAAKQQQLCDTARYIVETRKLENEIADLRKFNDRSPKLNLGMSTFGRSLGGSYAKLNDNGRQNGSTLLLTTDSGGDDNEGGGAGPGQLNHQNSVAQPKSLSTTGDESDTSCSVEKKTENKIENNSCPSSNEKCDGNMENNVMGSTNSLWSRTSSGEGAKMFENFNRNLIKTIKAENPLHRGPRLCALRIQNGSNNILLDNIDSEIMPIVYTRPLRFLDEELDDTKDIITSKISMVMSKRNSCSSLQTNNESVKLSLTSQQQQQHQLQLVDVGFNNPTTEDNNGGLSDSNKSQRTDKHCDVVHSVQDVNSLELSLDNTKPPLQQQSQQLANKSIAMDIASAIIASNDNENGPRASIATLDTMRNVILHVSNCPDQPWNGLVECHGQPGRQQNYDVLTLGDNSLNSSFKNTTTGKSCTQSSSISSSGLEIDVQESALLRRQQLTRVAEWVENNSTQSDIKSIASATQSDHSSAQHSTSGSYNNCSGNNMPVSQNSNNSAENAGWQATAKSIPNGVHNMLNSNNNNNNNNVYHYHNNAQHFTTDNKLRINIRQNCSDTLAHSNYYSFSNDALASGRRFYSTETGDTISIQPTRSDQQTDSVDIAQMEYNVKQFLLKQNEWSIRNVDRSVNSSSSVTSPDRSSITAGNNCNSSNNNENQPVKNHSLPLRTETNL